MWSMEWGFRVYRDRGLGSSLDSGQGLGFRVKGLSRVLHWIEDSGWVSCDDALPEPRPPGGSKK